MKKVNIETTNHCNAKCIPCPNKDMARLKGFMSLGLLDKIFEQLPNDVEEIWFSLFGEPLMDVRIPFILMKAKYLFTLKYKFTRKMKLMLYTNGSLFNEKTNKIFYHTLDKIIISFLGWDKHSYQKSMGLDFNSVYHKIRMFLDNAPEKLDAKVMCLDTGLNPKQKAAFMKLFPEGIIYPARNWADYQTKENGISVPCGRPNSLNILWDGRVVPCCRDYEATEVLGDLNRQSVMEAWNSPGYVKLREAFNQNKKPLEICKKCYPV